MTDEIADLEPRVGKIYKIPFRIRKEFFERVLAGTKNYEVRNASEFWDVRMIAARKHLEQGGTVKAVLTSGDRTLVKTVKAITFYAGNKAPPLPPDELMVVLPTTPMAWRVWRVEYAQ